MTIRPKKLLLYPLLAVSMTLAMAATAHAQSASLQVNFGTTPHWTVVRGTRVEEIPASERPGYDMFRYGGTYYAYNNNRWYTSRRGDGEFVWIDDRSVPSELSMVPRDHWRNYPSGWDRNNQGYSGTSGSLQVHFGTTPRWTAIRGTRVEEISGPERPGYDMFRYGGDYYAYNDNQWYTSRRWDGEFTSIDDRSVPSELSVVPRDHWRNYPSGWDRNDQGSNGTSGSLQVNFGTTPRWSVIRGTRVNVIRQRDRPDYDMFRYGRNYYVYSNHRWYMSRNWRGRFNAIDDRDVPNELTRVPREVWRNYPTAWQDQNGNSRYGRNGQRR